MKGKRKPVRSGRRAPSTTAAPLPDRRLMDRTMSAIQKAMSQQQFSSIEEANAFLERYLAENDGRVPDAAAETPAEQAQELVYEALESKGKKRLDLARRALELYPDCADAYILLAEESARTPEEARPLYEQAVAAAGRTLGPDYFTDPECVGHFWGIVETRPYMRARAALGQVLWDMGERGAALEHHRELLRLNPDDNQGLRHTLVVWLIVTGRDDEARDLLKRYPGEDMAVMEYIRALLAFKRHGCGPKARKALRRAFARNPHVPAIMVRGKRLPEQPDYYGFGDENEAIATIYYSLEAWVETPGAAEWLGNEFIAVLEEMG